MRGGRAAGRGAGLQCVSVGPVCAGLCTTHFLFDSVCIVYPFISLSLIKVNCIIFFILLLNRKLYIIREEGREGKRNNSL